MQWIKIELILYAIEISPRYTWGHILGKVTPDSVLMIYEI
jgi:hypothetical protein